MSFLWILTQIIHIEILWRKYVLCGDYLRYDLWIRTMYWSLVGPPTGTAPKTVITSFLNQPGDISLPVMDRAPENFFLSCTDAYGPVLIQTQYCHSQIWKVHDIAMAMPCSQNVSPFCKSSGSYILSSSYAMFPKCWRGWYKCVCVFYFGHETVGSHMGFWICHPF